MQHKGLAAGRWAQMPFMEQMANIGSEVYRTLQAKRKGEKDKAWSAFCRCLELVDLTIQYGRSDDKEGRDSMLKEICRLRECLCEAYLSEDPEALAPYDEYFYHFSLGYQLLRHREAAGK